MKFGNQMVRWCAVAALGMLLGGCASMMPLNVPTTKTANAYEAADELIELLNTPDLVGFHTHLSLDQSAVLDSNIKRLQVLGVFSRYMEPCEEGAYFTGLEENVPRKRATLYLTCAAEETNQSYVISLRDTGKGYLVEDVDNLTAGYSFHTLVSLFLVNASATNQRIQRLSSYLKADSCERLKAALNATPGLSLPYGDQSFVAAKSAKLGCKQLFSGSALEAEWLQATETRPDGRAWLAASYLVGEQRWDEAENMIDIAFSRYREDWLLHSLAGEIKLKLRKDQEALYHATQAFLQAPQPATATILLADAFAKVGQTAQAREMLSLMTAQYGPLAPEDFQEVFPELAKIIADASE